MTKQEELFVQNEKLVYFVLNKILREIPNFKMYKDDMMQQGFLGLLRACRNFDKDKGNKFSTYASKTIKGYMYKYIEKELRSRRKHRLQFVSLETEVNEKTTLADTIVSEPYETPWIFTDKRLTDKQLLVCKLLYEGYNQTEIGKELGCSQVQISRIIKQIKSILQED